MLKEINYDIKKLTGTEKKLKAMVEVMTKFSQKIIEQDTITEKSTFYFKKLFK